MGGLGQHYNHLEDVAAEADRLAALEVVQIARLRQARIDGVRFACWPGSSDEAPIAEVMKEHARRYARLKRNAKTIRVMADHLPRPRHRTPVEMVRAGAA